MGLSEADYEKALEQVRTLEVGALLTKPSRLRVDLEPRYVGFEIADRFAVGYGLDHAENYRNLPFIADLDS